MTKTLNGSINFREFLAFGKMFYARGSSWVSIIMSLSTLAIIAKLYEDFVRIHLGLDVQTTIFILIPLYIIGSVCAGYLDFRYGIYKIESDISYRAAPLSDKMRLDIIEIKELLLCLNNKK